jgi:hypothetical protein
MVLNPKVDYHRNGVSGNGFYVVLFDTIIGTVNDIRHMVATVFKEKGNVSILDRDKLAEGVFEFGINSWDGGWFEPELRKAIAAFVEIESNRAAHIHEILEKTREKK